MLKKPKSKIPKIEKVKKTNIPNTYEKHLMVSEEVAACEKQLNELKVYLDSIDLENLKDRIHWRETRTGQMPLLTASIETQVKSKFDMTDKLVKMLDFLDDLRNKYAEQKMKTRGDIDIENTILDDF